jgi:hypothetical protein
MYRALITPTETSLTIELPQDLVGKPIEVLAFDIQTSGKLEARKKPSAKEINQFYAAYQVDMSGYKFNRDEANER